MKSFHDVLMPRSAYLHIPFCFRRCFYCDFVVVPLGDRADGAKGPGSRSIKDYLKLLEREISLSPQGPPLATIYIGGGTPSLLSPPQIGTLLARIKAHFGFLEGAEITMEMDPASFNKDDLLEFLKVGVNRVSLGGQSFNDSILEKIGRTHRQSDLLKACEWLHQAQVERKLRSWNLDLIQSLPEQTLATWKNELCQAISTGAPHLSIYDLSIEPGTVFAWKKRRGELILPDEELSAEMMEMTNEIVSKAGLSRYEISNYAKPGHSSRHNRVYWSGRGWWAFGQGATSAPWGRRFMRPKTRLAYRHWLETQKSKGLETSLLPQNSTPMPFDERVLVGLRTREGVDLHSLAKEWGWSSQKSMIYLKELRTRWKSFFERGLLKEQGSRLKLSKPLGMAFSNQVFVELLLWWNDLPPDAVALPNYEEHLNRDHAFELMED